MTKIHVDEDDPSGYRINAGEILALLPEQTERLTIAYARSLIDGITDDDWQNNSRVLALAGLILLAKSQDHFPGLSGK